MVTATQVIQPDVTHARIATDCRITTTTTTTAAATATIVMRTVITAETTTTRKSATGPREANGRYATLLSTRGCQRHDANHALPLEECMCEEHKRQASSKLPGVMMQKVNEVVRQVHAVMHGGRFTRSHRTGRRWTAHSIREQLWKGLLQQLWVMPNVIANRHTFFLLLFLLRWWWCRWLWWLRCGRVVCRG